MHHLRRETSPVPASCYAVVVTGLVVLGVTSCSFPRVLPPKASEPLSDRTWPEEHGSSRAAPWGKTPANGNPGGTPPARALDTSSADPLLQAPAVNDGERNVSFDTPGETDALASPNSVPLEHVSQWLGSPHEQAGVKCADCHDSDPNAGTPVSVDQPETCYRCHPQMRYLQEIVHPHQILGPNGFNCTTCHDPHGRISVATRRDQCVDCHRGAPTMAWHSSRHAEEGVACADCHDPHPAPGVRRLANITHTRVRRPQRLPMSVQEPTVCYGCHQAIYGRISMPSRHPILEGKMVCSRCHDAHGQQEGHLKADSVNELCYECHAEKEGPFVYEHQPVTENCSICHEPHGTVANNLLRQPPAFLCLRCHSGHSAHDQFIGGQPPGGLDCDECHAAHNQHGQALPPAGVPGTNTLDDMGIPDQAARRVLFTDCTQCHAQVHGSDVPSGLSCGRRLSR